MTCLPDIVGEGGAGADGDVVALVGDVVVEPQRWLAASQVGGCNIYMAHIYGTRWHQKVLVQHRKKLAGKRLQ